ncbi:hypothetical protein [Shewanella sp. FJAT-52076]|uniref:hypothetical protein n=1 Tax=Shewanella sp. FJAT-52076 TaxID=2864202 RepID=UPI001C65E593|nr:hypothetical protein [Shewanella sp. FJAT-52076]QYJ75441.1 hypothetical protein K0H79_00025 [Shewanella sp. FJAT-52076]
MIVKQSWLQSGVCLMAGVALGYVVSKQPTAAITALQPLMPPAVAEKPNPTQPPFSVQTQTDNTGSSAAGDKSTETIAALQRTIAALQSENDYLKEALHKEAAETKALTASTDAAQDSMQNNSPDKRADSVAVEDAERYLPAPFAALMAKQQGMLAELFITLQTEPKDDDWAVVMEQQISDFILTHAQSGDVEIQAINCKKKTCEIRGFELIPKGWDKIFKEMVDESWWTFRSTAASYDKSAEFGEYFYLVASGV